jgi:hypothetical protein
MSKHTVRANAQTLPDATPHPDASVRDLAAQFEAALKTYQHFYHGGGNDDEAAAATKTVKAIAQKIISVQGTDISIMRLKARVYLWAESTDLEKLAKEGGDWPSEAVLASLFRDLGVADLETAPGTTIMADRALAQNEAADLAAMSFEPVPVETLAKLQAISDQEWLNHLVTIRLAFIGLSRTKEELKKGIAMAALADDEFNLIKSFQNSIEFLSAGVEFLTAAKTRLLCAAAALELAEEARS